ncbi:MAG: type IV pilus modification PilV family protein [Planctomycetota bacterium]|jgi:prepilin-type N-terminal cleavage/methylation domain-containing protein
MPAKKHKGGFSLLEVLLAIVLVGIAVASLVAANGSFTKGNAAGTELSTAEFLIEQIRELTILLPVVDPETEYDTFGPEVGEATLAEYDDLDDLDDAAFSPPINADRMLLNDFAPYVQQITVENVSAGDFEQVVADRSSNFVRITVTITVNSRQISSADWVRAWYEAP